MCKLVKIQIFLSFFLVNTAFAQVVTCISTDKGSQHCADIEWLEKYCQKEVEEALEKKGFHPGSYVEARMLSLKSSRLKVKKTFETQSRRLTILVSHGIDDPEALKKLRSRIEPGISSKFQAQIDEAKAVIDDQQKKGVDEQALMILRDILAAEIKAMLAKELASNPDQKAYTDDLIAKYRSCLVETVKVEQLEVEGRGPEALY